MTPQARTKQNENAVQGKIFLQVLRTRTELESHIGGLIFKHNGIAKLLSVGREITYQYVNEKTILTQLVQIHFYYPTIYFPGKDDDEAFSDRLSTLDFPKLIHALPREEKTNHFKYGLQSVMGVFPQNLFLDANGFYRTDKHDVDSFIPVCPTPGPQPIIPVIPSATRPILPTLPSSPVFSL